MTHIKRIVMHGFKSFARKTDIPFEDAMNVIVGPNGSGKSNITDALCFVLGRLSIKSIRAAKAANLLFTGNKIYKGAKEAAVELIFDNSDKSFGIDSNEVRVKRVVRNNGQSVYKINDQTKTRQDLLELLAQAGVDPNGFNIVLQGEIQSLVKSTPEQRRKIIEEVAGISIYETRKQKSLRELEKTEEKLNEVSAILRERNSYLKNLDKERQEAISYQKLEESIKKCKATLISKELKEKEKESWGFSKIIENHIKEISKIKKEIHERNIGIEKLQDKTTVINKQIQSSTSNELDVIHTELSDLKANLAGLTVRKENFDNRIVQGNENLTGLKEKISLLNEEISKSKTSSPKIKEQKEKQKNLQEKFDLLEKQRRKFYILKSEISTSENQKVSIEKYLIESSKEVQLIEQNISSLFNEIKYTKSVGATNQLKIECDKKLNQTIEKISSLEKEILENEKSTAILQTDIKREEKLYTDISNLESCPICKQKVGKDHKHEITTTSSKKINFAKKKCKENDLKKNEDLKNISFLNLTKNKLRTKINELDIDIFKLKNSEEKSTQIKKISYSQSEKKEELSSLNKKLNTLREEISKLEDIEKKYDETRFSLQELSFIELDSSTENTIKSREVNRLNVELKSITRDCEDSSVESKKFGAQINEKEKILRKKELEEEKLYEKFQEFYNERNELQDKLKALETDLIGFQHTIKNFEDKINHNKIQRAEITAQLESLKTELITFGNIELLPLPVDQLRERLQQAQFKISRLGNVNLRALEAYDKIKEQCELIQEKVEIIRGEEEKVKKIIAEIDKKKKKSFLTTLHAVNEYFTRNFNQLSRKSQVFLDLEDKKDPFNGGLNIIVKISSRKYFDITSLSGGEKTMVALALIFAIQEYKPYCFYIFDEIDAALDKHNSELLSALIKKYMTTGQYIIITHNDTLITEATSLYGVSMQDNISKIVSLKV